MGDVITCRTLEGAADEVRQVRHVRTPHPTLQGGVGVRHGKTEAGFQGGATSWQILGVDIGNQGAAALLTSDRELIEVADLPLLADGPSCRPTVNGALFAGLVRRWQPAVAFVEFVGPRPHDGAKAAFAFGGARATIETALTVLGVRVAYLTPPVWKRLIGIPPGAGMKDVARSAAVRRWPAKAELFARARDDGRAEAALIAVAGMMRDATSSGDRI